MLMKSVWAALEYPGFLEFPETTAVYLKPHLDALEQMICGIYLVHSQRMRQLVALVAQCKADFGEHSRIYALARCLQLLVTEYAPCLFNLGMSVRECYWMLQQANTGIRARDLLSFCLTFLLALEKSEKNEYCRVISMAIVTWNPLLSSLPAAAFVEEVLEASLSKLARFCATDLRRHSVTHFSEAFASLGCGRKLVDVNRTHIAEALPGRILIRLDKAIGALRAGRFPVVVGTGLKTFGTFATNSNVYVPKSPLHEATAESLRRCVYHTMLTMLESTECDADVMAALRQACVYAPAVDADALEAARQAVDECKTRLRRCLGRTPVRRYRDAAVEVPADGVDVRMDSVAPHSVSSQATVALDLPSELALSTLESSVASMDTASTDPFGYSTVSPTCSECGSFTSDDTRSPACTSGSEGEH